MLTRITTTAAVGTAVTPLGTAGMIAPFVYRASKATTAGMLTMHNVGGAARGNNALCTQEDIASPAMMEFGSSKPSGDTAAVFVDTAASPYRVPAKSRLCQHWPRRSTAPYASKSKDRAASLAQHRSGRLRLRLRNDRGELVSTHRASAKCFRSRNEYVLGRNAPRERRGDFRSTV